MSAILHPAWSPQASPAPPSSYLKEKKVKNKNQQKMFFKKKEEKKNHFHQTPCTLRFCDRFNRKRRKIGFDIHFNIRRKMIFIFVDITTGMKIKFTVLQREICSCHVQIIFFLLSLLSFFLFLFYFFFGSSNSKTKNFLIFIYFNSFFFLPFFSGSKINLSIETWEGKFPSSPGIR